MGLHNRLRATLFGLSTVLGIRPMGYFIPERHAGAAKPEGYPAIGEILRACEGRFSEHLCVIDGFSAALMHIARSPEKARFTQDWFPRLDAACAYSIVRHIRPKKIIEVGSGHSTRFMARAVVDGAFDCTITCIDPQPRAKLDGLAVEHRQMLVQAIGSEIFASLQTNDILFIDSSHIAMPGSDVDRLFIDILPRLAPGVLVHVHDIFLPDAYPEDWTWRGYNEQMLAGLLLAGGGYECLFASHYVTSRMSDAVAATIVGQLPRPEGARETSLWLCKR